MKYLKRVGWSGSGAESSLESVELVVYKLEWLVLCDMLLELIVPVAAVEYTEYGNFSIRFSLSLYI